MPLLPNLYYGGMSYFSEKILHRPRQNCLFAKRFDARPVNTAHANDRSNDSATVLMFNASDFTALGKDFAVVVPGSV
jgi:hypothetical protein